jgi:hypothetical protein
MQENFAAKYRECLAKNWPEGQEVQGVNEAKQEGKRDRDTRAVIAGGEMRAYGVVRFLGEERNDSSGEIFEWRTGTAG